VNSGRSFERARVHFDVALEESGRQVFAPALNLSPSGILIAAEQPPPVGSPVRVVMSLPPNGVFVRLQGRVVRHATEQPLQGAFAVVFQAVEEQTVEELRSFVTTAANA
jgi:hypothetical protein